MSSRTADARKQPKTVPRLSTRRRKPRQSLVESAARTLPLVDRRLRRAYGDVPRGAAPLGNKRNPLDELVYIQLSVRTRESAYQGTYPLLRRLVGGVWERLLTLPDIAVLPVMESGGMARIKLARLREQFAMLRELYGRVTLAPLREMTTDAAEAVLRSLPGVGPKVARCVLLYSLERAVFPVDSNCHRVLARLGFLPRGMHPKAGHDFLQEIVPHRIRRSLHVNLVHHGRATCTVGVPRCGTCPLLQLCPTGKSLVSRGAAVVSLM